MPKLNFLSASSPMLLVLAREYRELYDAICARLHLRSALALACTCTAARTHMHDIVRWYVRMAQTLSAIARIRYCIMQHMFASTTGNTYAIEPMTAESVRTSVARLKPPGHPHAMCDSVPVESARVTIAYICSSEAVASWRTAKSYLRIGGVCMASAYSITTYTDITVTKIRSGLNKYWIAYYMWTARRLQLHHTLHLSAPHRCLCAYLGARGCRALACANYADYTCALRSHAIVWRGGI